MTRLRLGALMLCVLQLAWAAPLVPPRTDPGSPRLSLTPGSVVTSSRAVICAKGYAGRVRLVPASRKDSVFTRYGIEPARRKGFVIDHLIPLELGGSNLITNLFPQDTASSHLKDRAENWARREACSGRQSVISLQRQMRMHWRTLVPR